MGTAAGESGMSAGDLNLLLSFVLLLMREGVVDEESAGMCIVAGDLGKESAGKSMTAGDLHFLHLLLASAFLVSLLMI